MLSYRWGYFSFLKQGLTVPAASSRDGFFFPSCQVILLLDFLFLKIIVILHVHLKNVLKCISISEIREKYFILSITSLNLLLYFLKIYCYYIQLYYYIYSHYKIFIKNNVYTRNLNKHRKAIFL